MKDTRSSADEITLCFREYRAANECMQGVNIPSSSFQILLEQQCSLSNPACVGQFSEDGALAMQLVCERAVINVISKATGAWKARTEETQYQEFPFVTGDDMVLAYDEAKVKLEGRV